MGEGLIFFFLIPLMVYTYFWLNPTAFVAFSEGLLRYFTEVYLGYKNWRLEYETCRAYKYFQGQSRKLARENGISESTLQEYFKKYKQKDWNFLYSLQKEEFERKNKSFEDGLKDSLVF